MSTLEAGTVQRSITVDASQEHAFVVFTREMTSWWPIDSHHIGEKDMERAVMEEKAGGRWFERAGDGTECEWGRVLEWEPPDRVVLAWHLTADWQYDPNPAASSEIEVRFIAESATTTRVELEHRGLEVYGARADEVRAAIGGEGGWSGLLQRFKEAAEK